MTQYRTNSRSDEKALPSVPEANRSALAAAVDGMEGRTVPGSRFTASLRKWGKGTNGQREPIPSRPPSPDGGNILNHLRFRSGVRGLDIVGFAKNTGIPEQSAQEHGRVSPRNDVGPRSASRSVTNPCSRSPVENTSRVPRRVSWTQHPNGSIGPTPIALAPFVCFVVVEEERDVCSVYDRRALPALQRGSWVDDQSITSPGFIIVNYHVHRHPRPGPFSISALTRNQGNPTRSHLWQGVRPWR